MIEAYLHELTSRLGNTKENPITSKQWFAICATIVRDTHLVLQEKPSRFSSPEKAQLKYFLGQVVTLMCIFAHVTELRADDIEMVFYPETEVTRADPGTWTNI